VSKKGIFERKMLKFGDAELGYWNDGHFLEINHYT
jgi:hypothetical protein